MAKISELAVTDPAAAGAELLRQYLSCHDAWLADKENVRHPSFDTKAWRQTARDAGTMREAATDEGGLGPVEIQKRGASDDVQPEKDAGSNAGNGGPTPAQDGRYTVTSDSRPVFETSDGRVLHGNDALLARARQSNPSRAAKMAAHIKGWDRLK